MDQATAWAEQWGSQLDKQEAINWPTEMGPLPPQLMVHASVAAAMTFLVGTGLGWDGIHPRAICRLSYDTLLWFTENT